MSDRVFCDSAGTISTHAGHAPDARMSSAGERRSISFFGQSRKYRKSDFETFDLILAMDHQNKADLEAVKPADSYAKIQLFGHFIDPENPPEVPDPYYGGARGFDIVLDMVEKGCENLMTYIQELQTA